MPKVKVSITERKSGAKLPPGFKILIRRACLAVLNMEKFEGNAEVSVCIVDEKTIKELNRQHRDIDQVTDVLSFPLGENGVYDKNPELGTYMLGDVVICAQRAMDQAREYGHSLQREIAYLTVHSMLHLLGYDHVNNAKEVMIMRDKEELVMSALGLLR